MILHNLCQFENRVGSIMGLSIGCNTKMGLGILFSGTSGDAMLASVGRSSGGSRKNAGPFIQRPLISQTLIPRLRSSAGFSLVGTYFQVLGSQVAWISATRTPTNGFNSADSERSHARTIMESVHRITFAGLILNSSCTVFANLEANRAAISSKRGIVVWQRVQLWLWQRQDELPFHFHNAKRGRLLHHTQGY